MRLAIAVVLGALAASAGAQPLLSEAIEAVAKVPAADRTAEAQRLAIEIMGPRPASPSARRAWEQAVDQRRQIILDGVAAVEQRQAEEWRRLQVEEAAATERRRALELCRLNAPAGARHWEYIHACYGQRR